MEFFGVFWFDLLLVLILAIEAATLWLRTGGKNLLTPSLTVILTVAAVLCEIASLGALLYLEATLTDVLIVLMIYAFTKCVASLIETKYTEKHFAENKTPADGSDGAVHTAEEGEREDAAV